MSKTSSTNLMLTTTQMKQVPIENHRREANKAVFDGNNTDSRTTWESQPDPVLTPLIKSEISDNILEICPESIQTKLDDIKKKFDLQSRDVYQIEHELAELEQLKRQYDDLNPAVLYLRKHDYSDINVLNRKIENLEAEKKKKLEAAKAETDKIESRLKSFELILREHMTKSSRTDNSDERRNLQNDYLKEVGFSNMAAVMEAITITKAD
ncbi:unnamed protein product [Rotaria sp. Silwood2]|nr:unnamed protein product [Rotaria sp. Silwood2]